MHLTNHPTGRLLCTERLEGRCLLSGVPSQVEAVDVSYSGPVELLELEDAEEEDGDVQIAPSQLPDEVLAAFYARFPGAEVIEAEFDLEDDLAQYGVSAEFNGQDIDVTLSPDGSITEVEQFVSSSKLPQPILDWIREKYPDAEIDEAAIVDASGTVTYEVLLAPAGQAPFEATLSLRETETPTPAEGEGEQPAPASVAETIPDDPDDREASLETQAPVTELADSSTHTAYAPSSTPQRTQDNQSVVQPEHAGSIRAAATESVWSTETIPFVEPVETELADEGGAVWFPEIAGVLSNVLPIDVAAIERELKRMLQEVDSLAQKVLIDMPRHSGPLRLAAIAAIIAGAQLVLLDRKVRKGGPLFVFNAANTTWSWVLGAPPARP